jgi:DNA-binding NtrC family response regulator
VPNATLLIVDDEVLLRMSISDYLQDIGFKILEAANLNEAKVILETADVDLIVTNLWMHGHLDGIELAKFVRLVKPGLPVVFISGNPPADVERELGGGQHFLQKPVNYREMADLITTLLESRMG